MKTNSTDKYLASFIPNFIKNNVNPSLGSIRYNCDHKSAEVYTGKSWVEVAPNDVAAVTDDYIISELCKTHPGLQELKNKLDTAEKQYLDAKEQFDVYLNLVKK